MIAALTNVSNSDVVLVVARGLYLKLVVTRISIISVSYTHLTLPTKA